jgi:hypothetical protein
MDIGDIVLTEGQREAWVPWRDDVEVRLRFLTHADDRDMLKKIQKAQFRGHQKVENEIDLVAMRNYFCKHVIKGFKGLTKDGEPFEPTEEETRRIWDGTRDFSEFCVDACREVANFREEKKT